ncbi:MAG TPA: NAD-dependent protein deacylase, partial [Lachnospiraceae bacterium]|nr:NAD-dependent protein deacylase [Lachnospiraceae bacterium]
TFYVREKEEFYKFYRDKLLEKTVGTDCVERAKPNAAHITLAKLEAAGKLKAVITQNIDGLHQEAGSKKVLELHGSVHRNYCEHCRKEFDAKYMFHSLGIPVCDVCGSSIKPDVVLYEEGLDNSIITEAVRCISDADLLIIGGTSLVVYPAAGLIDYYNGNKLVLINRDSTPKDNQADYVFHANIGEILGAIKV